MKKIWKRYLILYCLIPCIICSGCKGREESKNTSAQVLFPEEENTVITWYLSGEDQKIFENLKGIKEIQKRTGIQIEFIAPSENAEDAYKLMIATGDLPDIIQWNYDTYANGNGVNQLYSDGIAIELTDLIAKYAPNLSRIYQERPDILSEVNTSDDKLFYFPVINPMLTKEESYRKAFNGLIIRKDWLDAVGMDVPEDMEEWYQVLKAFQQRDPNSNGLQDEIPYDGKGLDAFMTAYGITDGFSIDKDNNVIFGSMQPEYKEYLETMHQWYLEGLIGKNSVFHSDKWTESNIINNLTGAFYGLDNAWNYYLPSLLEKDTKASFEAVPWPKTKDGKRYTKRPEMKTHIGREVTIITSQCKNPEAAVKLIDYFYSGEGSDLLTWGIEGESYDKIDGKKIIRKDMLEVGESGYLKLFDYALAHTGFPKYEGETVVLQYHSKESSIAEETWADADTSLIYPPTLYFNATDDEVINQIMTDVNSYINSMSAKFITGEESLSSFDSYIETLKKMQIEKVIEIYQRNYREYAKSNS